MEEIQRLIDGNKEFQKTFFGKNSALFDDLIAHGQKPKIMTIACSDSRVDPAMIFNCQPGQLFVVRNIANLIPPCENNDTYHGTSAALEFGINFLGVEHIIIFGHTQCGGIQTLLEKSDAGFTQKKQSFIAKWMQLAQPAYNQVMAHHKHLPIQEKATICTQYALINSLNNLRSFPWVNERITRGTLEIHAWYFDLATGGIYRYDQINDRWLFSS